ncbi:hypothetical protein V6N13_040010 [Hibiscus sabdariffa]
MRKVVSVFTEKGSCFKGFHVNLQACNLLLSSQSSQSLSNGSTDDNILDPYGWEASLRIWSSRRGYRLVMEWLSWNVITQLIQQGDKRKGSSPSSNRREQGLISSNQLKNVQGLKERILIARGSSRTWNSTQGISMKNMTFAKLKD